MKNFLESFAKDGGYCCPYRFLRTIKRFRTGLLAVYYGVSPRTVRVWKAKFKDKAYTCPCAGLGPGIRQQRGWAECQRGKDLHHALDDPNTARRYSDICRDTASVETSWWRSRRLTSRDTS